MFSSLFKSKNANKMPRNARKQDPFARIQSWDDGYEYIRDRPPSPPGARDPHLPYESYRRKPARDVDDEDRYVRRAYPSPPDSEGYPRRRQPQPPYRARSPSPPRRSRRDDPPPSTRHRPRRTSLDSRSPVPRPAPIGRSKSMRDGPRSGRGYSRSPSPQRRYRRRSPSPVLPGGKLHHRDRDRDRDWERDWGRERQMPRDVSPPRRRRRSPSPPPRNRPYARESDRDFDRPYPRNPAAPTPPPAAPYPYPDADPTTPRRERDHRPKDAHHDGKRPDISRSKTTGAAASPGTKARLANLGNLSPRWQQAAAAALQAGSLAALNMRSQPGAWSGEKGARVATAALGAGVLDALNGGADKKKKGSGSGSKSRRNSGVEALGGALGGFLADQFVHKGKKRY